jgi:hypothetical protein
LVDLVAHPGGKGLPQNQSASAFGLLGCPGFRQVHPTDQRRQLIVRTGQFKVMLPLTFTVLGSTNHALLLGVSLWQMG